MKTSTLKLALISASFAFTVIACNSNRNEKKNADSDTTMMGTEGMSTDTMMDTSATGTTPGDTGRIIDTIGKTTPPTP